MEGIPASSASTMPPIALAALRLVRSKLFWAGTALLGSYLVTKGLDRWEEQSRPGYRERKFLKKMREVEANIKASKRPARETIHGFLNDMIKLIMELVDYHDVRRVPPEGWIMHDPESKKLLALAEGITEKLRSPVPVQTVQQSKAETIDVLVVACMTILNILQLHSNGEIEDRQCCAAIMETLGKAQEDVLKIRNRCVAALMALVQSGSPPVDSS